MRRTVVITEYAFITSSKIADESKEGNVWNIIACPYSEFTNRDINEQGALYIILKSRTAGTADANR